MLAFLSGFLVAIATLASAAPTQDCRCAPGQSCWPTSADLDSLSGQLSSPSALLRSLQPPAFVCHEPTYNATACDNVKGQWSDLNWRTAQPGGTVNPLFESQAAYCFNASAPLSCGLEPQSSACGQGQTAGLGISAANEDDVATALAFAKRHNLQVTIKGTGHDLLGRSSAKDSFLIWTHKLKQIEIKDSFTPAGCPSETATPAIRLGAGVQWQEAYDSVASTGRILVGGLSTNGTVSASGGWISGAGHSIVSPTYGLGIDNAVQFRLVLPSSGNTNRTFTVSACSHPDLFWAIRGGGGGTFGVLTEVVYKTHADAPGLLSTFTASTTNVSVYQSLLSVLYGALPALAEDKWGGYSFFVPQPPSHASSSGRYNATLLMYRANTSDPGVQTRINGTMSSLLANLSTIANSSAVGSVKPLPSYAAALALFPKLLGSTGGSSTSDASSSSSAMTRRQASPDTSLLYSITEPQAVLAINRFLPKAALQGESLKSVVSLAPSAIITGYHVAGGVLSSSDPNRASANPAWSSAVVEAVFSPLDLTKLKDMAKTVFDIAGGASGGTYLNEAGYYDPYWPTSFWGSHYDRLVRYKRKYDPDDQLIVVRGLLSDQWTEDLKCRKG